MYLYFKSFFDYIFALILFLFIIPILIIVSILIYIKIGSPIIFCQKRTGLYGKPFTMYKFRTMLIKHNKKGDLLPDNKRRSKIGDFLRKYSIDELPELINILKGEMSFIGPRPLLVDYLPLYNDFQLLRFKTKPGLSGWAQINGRNSLSWKEKFKLDVWYVENKNLLLDLLIILKTIKKIIIPSGINTDSNDSMPYFNGDN